MPENILHTCFIFVHTKIFLLFDSFHEISRSMYAVNIKAVNDIVLVNVPENVSGDVAGNKNLASNVLQVSHCKDLFFAS